jgi:protein TonB
MGIPLAGSVKTPASEVYPFIKLSFEYSSPILSEPKHVKKDNNRKAIKKTKRKNSKKQKKQQQQPLNPLVNNTVENRDSTIESAKETKPDTFHKEEREISHQMETISAEPVQTDTDEETVTGVSAPARDDEKKEHTTVFGAIDGPRFLYRVIPRYPRIAKRLGVEGKVVLMLTIDEKGNLIDVEIIERAGYGFDKEAVKAVKESTYLPAHKDGIPVKSKALLTVRFIMKEGG